MSTEIIASKMKAENKNPGQNGFEGASSLTPGQTAPKAAANVALPLPTSREVADDWQTRPVSSKPAAPVHPMQRAIRRLNSARK